MITQAEHVFLRDATNTELRLEYFIDCMMLVLADRRGARRKAEELLVWGMGRRAEIETKNAIENTMAQIREIRGVGDAEVELPGTINFGKIELTRQNPSLYYLPLDPDNKN